jgi:small neutral amino acid transporter SnatA (MarC family)
VSLVLPHEELQQQQQQQQQEEEEEEEEEEGRLSWAVVPLAQVSE